MKTGTKFIHAGMEPDPSTGAIMTPIYQTSTYVQEAPATHKGYEYARSQNPTRTALEKAYAEIENGKFGLAFSSGVAATDAVDSLDGKKVSAADLRPLFIERMQLLLKKSSDGLYDLSVGDMQLDVLTSVLLFKNVKMTPDAAHLDSLRKIGEAPNDVYTASFDELRVEGINVDDALTSKTMDYKLVKLVRPVIVIHHTKDGQKGKGPKEEFSQRFLKEMEKLSIKKLVVEEGNVTVHNDTKKGAPIRLKHVSVVLNDFLVDSTTRNEKDRFLFAEKAMLSFKDYEKHTPDGLYRLKVDNVMIQAPQQQITLTGFSFTSPF